MCRGSLALIALTDAKINVTTKNLQRPCHFWLRKNAGGGGGGVYGGLVGKSINEKLYVVNSLWNNKCSIGRGFSTTLKM